MDLDLDLETPKITFHSWSGRQDLWWRPRCGWGGGWGGQHPVQSEIRGGRGTVQRAVVGPYLATPGGVGRKRAFRRNTSDLEMMRCTASFGDRPGSHEEVRRGHKQRGRGSIA